MIKIVVNCASLQSFGKFFSNLALRQVLTHTVREIKIELGNDGRFGIKALVSYQLDPIEKQSVKITQISFILSKQEIQAHVLPCLGRHNQL